MRANGEQALAAMRAMGSVQVGMCLSICQEAWQSGHAFPDAVAQWQGTTQHRDRSIPVGAPVFYSGGNHGHVALYAGNGQIVSSDAPGNGSVGTVPLDWPTQRWGHTFTGWGGTLAGHALPLGGPAQQGVAPVGVTVYLAKLRYGQTGSDSVMELQRRLGGLPVTGNYLDQTDSVVRSWQASIRDLVDPPRHSSLGPRQAARLWAGTAVHLV